MTNGTLSYELLNQCRPSLSPLFIQLQDKTFFPELHAATSLEWALSEKNNHWSREKAQYGLVKRSCSLAPSFMHLHNRSMMASAHAHPRAFISATFRQFYHHYTTRSMSVKSIWKKETKWTKSWKYYSRDSHANVKYSECMWKLFWNFFYTCEIFSHMRNNFSLDMKFLCSCEIFFTTQFYSVCEMFSHMRNNFFPCMRNFFPRETILSCIWNFLHTWNFMFHMRKIFSHMGNSLVMHVKFSKHVNTFIIRQCMWNPNS